MLIRNNQELFLIKRRDTAAQPGYTVLVAGSHGVLEDRVRSEAEGAGVMTMGQGHKRSPLCEQNQHTPSTRSRCGAQGWELRPHVKMVSSTKAAQLSCRQGARPGGTPVPRAGGPRAVSVQPQLQKPPSDAFSEVPSLPQSRSRAASQGTWPAGAAALPCWGYSSSQGGLVGCRNGCQLPPTGSFPRMLLGKPPYASARAQGDLSAWW